MTTADPQQFGRWVATRRRKLGMTPEEVRAAGGPGKVTLHRIEVGNPGNLHLETFKKLDLALRWQPGSAADAHDHGTTPSPLPANGNGSVHEWSDVPAPPSVVYVAFPPGVIDEVCGVDSDLAAFAAEDERLAGVSVALSRVSDRILRAWTIAEIERMRVAGTLTAATVEMLLGHYLRRTPHAPTTEDHEELMYMRWLLGRLPEDCPQEMNQRFAARWSSVQQMLTDRPVPD